MELPTLSAEIERELLRHTRIKIEKNPHIHEGVGGREPAVMLIYLKGPCLSTNSHIQGFQAGAWALYVRY
jgi:hypothetical protein